LNYHRLRRKVLVSLPGISLLLLGVFNWFWTAYGMNLVYKNYYTYSSCTQFMNNVIWGNVFITAMFALPVVWILFWMILIKAASLILGLVAPGVLIWFKKVFNGIEL
jgi:hypothetical protein